MFLSSKQEKEQYQLWLRENEKNRVLELISERNTIDVSQISDYLKKSPDETAEIIKELEQEKLIISDVGTYYHLTYEGYKRTRPRK
jgi:Mn-dependent DtxR family transcriptional regulator